MDLSGVSVLRPLADVARDVQRAAKRAGAEIFIAGAIARDLWLLHGHQIQTGRATGDIDFAVQCADWDQFDSVARELIESGFTVPNATIRHRFRHADGTLVDLVPFGGLERADRTIAWPPDENQVMSLLGFREVHDSAVVFRLSEDVSVPVVSLPSLAALKLLAWYDRGVVAPKKDAEDLRVVLTSYSNVVGAEQLFQAIPELTSRADFDFERSGAELIGIELSRNSGEELLAALRGILKSEVDPSGNLRLARAMRRGDEENSRLLLDALLSGLRG